MAFLAGWSKRQKLTIDHTQVDDELTDFPVKVIVSSDNPLFDTAKSDGSDVRFTAADGETLLKFEREVHDTTEKIAVYHVKIPSVSSTSDTDFYLYYGNASASDASSPTSVWDSDYKLVLHMDGSLEDSTSNGNNGTNYGSTLGLASDGYYRSFDGVDDYISFGDVDWYDTASALTLMIYYEPLPGGDAWGGFIGKVKSGTYNGFHMNSSDETSIRVHGLGSNQDVTTTVAVNQLNTIHGIYTGSAMKIYRDGVLKGTLDNLVKNILDSGTIPLTIGKLSYANLFKKFNAHEVRISSIARSDAWIKATSASLHDELLTFGSEESAAPPIQGVHQGVQIIFI